MPRFYFHVVSEGDIYLDFEGMILTDAVAARGYALEHARDLLRAFSGRIDEPAAWRIEVADGEGIPLLFVLLSEVAAEVGHSPPN
jgi:hypothetical protein